MKKLRDMIPYLAVIVLDFYLLPFLIRDTGSAMLMLLIVVPLICFVCSLVYGIKKSFNLAYTIVVAILFIPTILIFYNSTAWVYIFGYGAIALVGNAIGMVFSKRRK
jgi:hypothetical protein